MVRQTPAVETTVTMKYSAPEGAIDGIIEVTIPNADLYLFNPAGFLFGPNTQLNLPGAFYVGAASGGLFKTTDQGNNWDCISPDLSHSAVKEKESLACGAIAESPLSAGVLYAGTDKGAFWYSRDDGKNWKEQFLD